KFQIEIKGLIQKDHDVRTKRELAEILQNIFEEKNVESYEIERLVTYTDDLNISNLCILAIKKNNNYYHRIFQEIINLRPAFVIEYKSEKGKSLLYISSKYTNIITAGMLIKSGAPYEIAPLHNFVIKCQKEDHEKEFFKFSTVNPKLLTSI